MTQTWYQLLNAKGLMSGACSKDGGRKSPGKAFYVQPGGRRLRRMSWRRWLDKVESDLRQVEVWRWRQRAHDTEEWKPVVTEVEVLLTTITPWNEWINLHPTQTQTHIHACARLYYSTRYPQRDSCDVSTGDERDIVFLFCLASFFDYVMVYRDVRFTFNFWLAVVLLTFL